MLSITHGFNGFIDGNARHIYIFCMFSMYIVHLEHTVDEITRDLTT